MVEGKQHAHMVLPNNIRENLQVLGAAEILGFIGGFIGIHLAASLEANTIWMTISFLIGDYVLGIIGQLWSFWYNNRKQLTSNRLPFKSLTKVILYDLPITALSYALVGQLTYIMLQSGWNINLVAMSTAACLILIWNILNYFVYDTIKHDPSEIFSPKKTTFWEYFKVFGATEVGAFLGGVTAIHLSALFTNSSLLLTGGVLSGDYIGGSIGQLASYWHNNKAKFYKPNGRINYLHLFKDFAKIFLYDVPVVAISYAIVGQIAYLLLENSMSKTMVAIGTSVGMMVTWNTMNYFAYDLVKNDKDEMILKIFFSTKPTPDYINRFGKPFFLSLVGMVILLGLVGIWFHEIQLIMLNGITLFGAMVCYLPSKTKRGL